MSNRALGVSTLLLTLAATPLSAFEEKTDEATDETEESTVAETRSVEPTGEEIARYQLPQTDILAPVDVTFLPEPSPMFQVSGFGMFAASAADFASTELGISRGLQEGNPVASDRGRRLVHHVVGPAAVWWTTERLQRQGKTKLAFGLRVALMAAYGYATLHNMRQVSAVPGSP
jgi:hypothetical protein